VRVHIRLVLDALLALVAWALAPGGQVPLVTLRLQVWMRELRRMVGKVTSDSGRVELRADKDLKARPDGFYLPLIQCSECHTTGWLSRLAPASRKLSNRLDEIYNTWFSGRSEAVRLYAGEDWRRPYVAGVPQHVCCACGNLQSNTGGCQACGHDELVAVFRTTGTRSRTRGNATFTWHDSTCPACGQRDRQILLGARNATLGAQVVAESWASPFNDDKKLIAFSEPASSGRAPIPTRCVRPWRGPLIIWPHRRCPGTPFCSDSSSCGNSLARPWPWTASALWPNSSHRI
jgi:DEAD/DEAH box helicase domain-containing protein